MASMPSTVCAGSSSADSRVPGPPPRTSIEPTAGSSKTTAVDAGAEAQILGVADFEPGNVGDEVAHASSQIDEAERFPGVNG